MTLPLTKEIVAAAYEYSRTTPPFVRWKLPPAVVVNFFVSSSKKHFAQYWWDGEKDNIEVSSNSIGHTQRLIEKVQHEMIHMKLRIDGCESKSNSPNVHNKYFVRYAMQACRYHGWDPKGFF